jgi:hypothetical protein
MERGKQLPGMGNSYTQKSIGLDPGFGSSAFGVCITELRDGIVNVLHAEEYPRPDFNQMIDTTVNLLDDYGITFESQCRVFVDGANPAFIRSLKTRVDEDPDYDQFVETLKHNYGQAYELKSLMFNMFVVPVNFSTEHKKMLAHCKQLLELNGGCVAIDEQRHGKLITALKTAVEKGEGTLDKEAISHDDCLDAFRLSLIFWHQ